MSEVQHTQLIPLTAYDGSAANAQPAPYYPGKTRVMRLGSHGSDELSFGRDHPSRPDVIVIPPPSKLAGHKPDPVDSTYNSGRRLEVPKLNRIGLLIDIYA